MREPKKKKQKWIKRRHVFVQWLARQILRPYIRIFYGLRAERFRDKRQCLVLMNHVTAFDQFFVSLSLRRNVYYVASEDLFSKGRLSRMISFLVAPIPIRKSMTDARAVLTCMRVAREGATIAMAPEGNRTYSGRTGHINPSVAPLCRALKLPVALYVIDGGFGVHPRFSDVLRRGKMTARVARVIEPEEYATMTDAELYEQICRGLYTDEATDTRTFYHARRAEYLERAIYYCPKCGASHFKSHDAEITCQRCGMRVLYNEDTTLSGVDCDFPYRYVADWYEAQCDFIRALDLAPYHDTPLFCDKAGLYDVIPYKNKRLLSEEGEIAVYDDRYELSYGNERVTIPFSDVVAVTVLGRNKLNIYIGSEIKQVKADKRFNALKYMNVYYRQKEGNNNAEFLGI